MTKPNLEHLKIKEKGGLISEGIFILVTILHEKKLRIAISLICLRNGPNQNAFGDKATFRDLPFKHKYNKVASSQINDSSDEF